VAEDVRGTYRGVSEGGGMEVGTREVSGAEPSEIPLPEVERFRKIIGN